MTLPREKYVLMEKTPLIYKENEGFVSYVVLPQECDLLTLLVQRYKQELEKKK